MKKLLTILLTVLMLVGCGKKVITYEDVREEYETLLTDVKALCENSTTYMKQDYMDAIEELDQLVNTMQKDIEEETGRPVLEKIYKLSHQINTIASNYSGAAATKVKIVTDLVDKLIMSTYDGTEEEFESVKGKTIKAINDLDEVTDLEWSQIEKKQLITWDEVKDKYEEIEKEAKDDMTDYAEVTEYELDDLKNIILDNYQKIQYGVTVYTEDIAEEIYRAGVQLNAYGKKASKKGTDVRKFGFDTKSYVKQCFGLELVGDDEMYQDYELDIEQASKWTQSVWNNLTTELKRAE